MYSTNSQFHLLLLYALRPLVNGATKEQVCARVEDKRWLDLTQEDLSPYPGLATREPRWMTLLAYARQRAVEFGYVENNERNHWKITEKGKNVLGEIERHALTRDYDVSQCFFFSYEFKALLDDTFAARPQKKRPSVVYEEDYERNVGLLL